MRRSVRRQPVETRNEPHTVRAGDPERRGPADEDRVTVERARRGDPAAFEALYRRHAGRVYGLGLRLGGDAARAEDLVQDVFLRAWRRLGTFEGRASFATWLYRLAVNRITDVMRSEIRRSEHLVPDGDAATVPLRGGLSPEARLDLEAAIRALPAGARLVFVLHDVEGHGHEEIAVMTGIAVGTSKSQLYRARRLLREMLSR